MEKIELLPRIWLCSPLGDNDRREIHVLVESKPTFFARVIPASNPEVEPHTVERIWTAGIEDEYSEGYMDEMKAVNALHLAGLLPRDINTKHFEE